MSLTRARIARCRRGALAVVAGGLLLAASAAAQDASGLKARGEVVFKEQGCYGCHTIGAFGTPIAPDLAKIGTKRDLPYLAKWLSDPQSQRATAHMPKILLRDADAEALAAYLASLR
jgi:mono/diheme cytochrome c family protein